ncbi:MAG TPA: M23 family metallopeptidase, partial [Crenalkalicoccus sp.]|nr:M23 family metallopeptidase [Crenalkalicoccus sp.]
TAPGTRLTLDGHPVRVAADGAFAFGFGRDAPARAVLRIEPPGGRAESETLHVTRRAWQIQKLQGLPEAMVTPPPEVMARIVAERERLAAIRRVASEPAEFLDGFAWPAQGRISGVYGSQRILNGEKRAPHLGLDIAVPTGTPVAAMAAGRVLLAAPLYFTGNTVILDHGLGVQSLYAHLSELAVAEGEAVARGGRIGLSGATGRVTGPHLHLGLNWFATAVDPRPVLPDLQA